MIENTTFRGQKIGYFYIFFHYSILKPGYKASFTIFFLTSYSLKSSQKLRIFSSEEGKVLMNIKSYLFLDHPREVEQTAKIHQLGLEEIN